MVVLVDNQALIEYNWCGKIVKAKDHVQFYIKFNSESFQICYMASSYHTHQYVGVFKLIYFVIFFIFGVLSLLALRKNVAWEKCKGL